jgi:hypothetical protein
MYWLGSWFAVGSWFFISVTSKVRKSLDEIVDALSPVPVDPVVPLDPAVFAAAVVAPAELAKAAVVPVKAAPAAMW